MKTEGLRQHHPDQPDDRYYGHLIHPAVPADTPNEACVGREDELERLRTCLGIDNQWRVARNATFDAFGHRRTRLEGPPGTGKRVLVRELARRLGLPLYEIQGHSDTSPEDLVLAVVPRSTGPGSRQPLFALQASPLATALLWGGVFYFDAIHRTAKKALAPLASLLDRRMTLYSSITGIELTPRPDAAPFIFICSTNPADAARIPEFLEQRTIPMLALKPLAPNVVRELVGRITECDAEDLRRASREEKRRILGNQYAIELKALQLTMQLSVFQEAVTYFKRGELLQALGVLADAGDSAVYEIAVLRSLKDVVVHRLRGQAQDLASQNSRAECAKASVIYRALASANSFQRYDRNNYAHALLYAGELDEALKEIEKELSETYPLAVAWVTHGEILEELGERENAMRSYTNAVELPPSPVFDGSSTREWAQRHLDRLTRE